MNTIHKQSGLINPFIEKFIARIGRKRDHGVYLSALHHGMCPYRQALHRESIPDYVALVSDRDEIFDNADFITLHMAATAENKHGIGAREFARMKKTACLINTARGSLVDEAALIEALCAGEIAGAGLDATEPEPADAASPLFRMENVIMTPHCGGSTKESKSRSSLGAAKGCDEVLTGKPITSPVL